MKFSRKSLWAVLLILTLLPAMLACDAQPPDVKLTATQTTDQAEAPRKLTFTLEIYHGDGSKNTVIVETDKATVGQALLEKGIIEGEPGDYGLYVKVVDGERADYDVDQSYWSFYIGEEYAMTGVDSISVTDGATYSFRYSK